MSVAGGSNLLVPMAAQYAFGKFGSPVNTKAGAVNPGQREPAAEVSTLLANNKAIPDPEAAGLVTAQRVQLRWRVGGNTGSWSGDRPRDLRRGQGPVHHRPQDHRRSR